MTAAEWFVIAIAAAVFIILNFIMWTAISLKNKAARRKAAKQAVRVESPAEECQTILIPPESDSENHQKRRKNMKNEDTGAFASPAPAPVQPAEKTVREDFKITESIVIIHTDEKME